MLAHVDLKLWVLAARVYPTKVLLQLINFPRQAATPGFECWY